MRTSYLMLMLGLSYISVNASKGAPEAAKSSISDSNREDETEQVDLQTVTHGQNREAYKHRALSVLYGLGLTGTLGALALSFERLINSQSVIAAAKNKLAELNKDLTIPDGPKSELIAVNDLLVDRSYLKWFYFPVTITALSYCCKKLGEKLKHHLSQSFPKKAAVKKPINTDSDANDPDDVDLE